MSPGRQPDPAAWEPCDAVLSDGGTVRIRSITPADGGALVALHERLSAETVYLRFFAHHPHLSEDEVSWFTGIDGDQRMALVATLRGRIVAVARYDRCPGRPEQAEVAFVVDDAEQGRGLGTLLLEHLAAYARARGVERFLAETLPHNRPMQEVFRRAGFVERSRYTNGLIQVCLEIQPTLATVEAIERRWARASARSIERVLRPRSVAVVGCAPVPGGLGHEVLRNILAAGFNGPVHPVDPAVRSVDGLGVHPDLEAVPGQVDLAVIAVPQPLVAGVVEQCAARGVRGLVVISGGYAETGPAGAAAQRDLVASSRGAGMRMVGPNCLGVVNTDPEVSLNATYAPVAPPAGRIALSSQSGGLGGAALREAHRRDIGLSSFVAVGNKADISGNDLLVYWEQDPGTDVIMLYLESFGNPRRFARVARQVSRSKPIVAVKAGRSAAGLRAAARRSPTPAAARRSPIPAAPDRSVDALFRQAGVIRVDTLPEMFDVASLLAAQPPPRGPRVAVIGHVGGPGILAVDAAEAAGLIPVDMVAADTAEDYGRAVRTVLTDRAVDAVIAIFVPSPAADPEPVAEALAAGCAGTDKTVAASFLGEWSAPAGLTGAGRRIPCFPFPEPAVHALARAWRYAEWRNRPEGRPLQGTDLHPARARTVVQAALDGAAVDGVWLGPGQVSEVLAAYGIALGPGTDGSAPGVETAVGVVQDQSFGPLVMFGSGGSGPDPVGDRAFRALPLTDVDAAELVREPRGSVQLFGDRESHSLGVTALEHLLMRTGRLAEDLPEVAEMDMDPVVVTARGVSVTGARIRLEPPGPQPDPALRRLL